MKFRIAALSALVSSSLCMVILTGCHAYAKLYPIEGPLSRLTPPPVFKAKVTGSLTTLHLFAVISNNENIGCKFNKFSWAKSDTFPGIFDFKPAWNAVYGDKFFEGHILGANNAYFWCDSTGDKGTVFHAAVQIDMAKDESRSQGVKGVVADDKGNIYKIAF